VLILEPNAFIIIYEAIYYAPPLTYQVYDKMNEDMKQMISESIEQTSLENRSEEFGPEAAQIEINYQVY